MAENTVTTPLAPMELDDAFAYMSGRCRPENIDTAGAVATTRDPAAPGRRRAHRHPGHRRGRLRGGAVRALLPGDGACLGFPPGIARAIIRSTENILPEDHGDVADVLRQLEAAGMKQAMEAHPAHRTTR
ncbi:MULTISPECIES: hypothetical protein [Streptomyces]|uniref:Uncharacterized protein n=1 Tax=Streptomyces eurythermus TaxID=42237 RepID=A0ABW6Z7H1_9ACTN|nr:MULTISPECIES: hypothetical protein [Streptomyces]QIS68838.1 hypothetical protein HB370_01490 [Streptomyces sp. DSM 40868]